MKNIKAEIISESDYEMLRVMAKKYNMTVENFGKLISKKMEKSNICQVRFNADELMVVDERAGKLNMTRNAYLRMCYSKALADELWKKIDVAELRKGSRASGEKMRDIRVPLVISDAEEYKELLKVSKELSIALSTLIRCFSLTIK